MARLLTVMDGLRRVCKPLGWSVYQRHGRCMSEFRTTDALILDVLALGKFKLTTGMGEPIPGPVLKAIRSIPGRTVQKQADGSLIVA